MPPRAATLLVSILALSACAPRMPQIDMSGVTLPRFEIFRYGVREETATAPYKLTQQNLVDVKSSFSAAFTDGRTLEFGPIDARRKVDGSLAVCGLVSVRNLNARATGMKLFDGTGLFDPFGVLRFEPNRLAGVNGKFLDIYTGCRNAGLL